MYKFYITIGDWSCDGHGRMGFEFENGSGMGCGIVSVPEMARLWIFLLQKTNPSLKLKIVKDDIPRLQFYGFDEKGRHIGGVGYGLFCG